MLKRLKRAWGELRGRKQLYAVAKHAMTKEQAAQFQRALGSGSVVVMVDDPNDIKLVEVEDKSGDGKAEFLGEGTHDEFKQQQLSDKGLRGIFGLK